MRRNFFQLVVILALPFLGKMSYVETASMMSDIGLIISQLCIIFRMLRYNIGATFFEPESKMKEYGKAILLSFDEHMYTHDVEITSELILYLIRDYVSIF